VIVMLRIVAGLLAAVLALLPFCAEAQREPHVCVVIATIPHGT